MPGRLAGALWNRLHEPWEIPERVGVLTQPAVWGEKSPPDRSISWQSARVQSHGGLHGSPIREGASSVLRKLLLVAATLALLGSAAAVAQAAPRAKASAANPRAAAAKGAADLVASRPARLHASAADTFVQRSVISTPEGLQYVPYVREHRGLPVVGGDFVLVTRPDGQVLSTSVAQQSAIGVSTTPSLTAKQAEQVASRQVPGVDKVQSTRLVIQAQLATPRLAYETVVTGNRGAIPSRLHVFVDAQTGDVLSSEDEVKDGTGTGWINGSGSGFPLRMGLNDTNAFWNGSYVAIGHNTAGKWVSSLDVVGHEFGHAIDSTTPGGQSGNGVSESTGDIFGSLSEGYANEPAAYDPPDYQVGEEVNLTGSGPIRYMYNPSLAGDPNCYSSSIPTAETHSAAGPFNHWFYLVAEGTAPSDGQPSSPTCNGSSVTGLGLQKAGRIFYNAMLSKTSGMTYLRYRTATLNAAKNLFPGGCTEFNTVKAAWDAVSVPAQAGDPTCSVNGAVTVNNPGNQTGTVGTAKSLQLTASGGSGSYSWSATGLPPGLSINTTSGLISGTPTTAGTYTTTATATSGSQSGSTQFTWTISPAGGGGCTSPGQKLANPGFESGGASWTASSGVIGQWGASGQPTHGGTWNAWLDGYGSTHTDTLSQSVTIPAGCTSS